MAHLHENIDYVADVYIVNDGAVLLRMHEKYDMWLAPGGHVELDEDFVEAAIREAKEETGLDVTLIGDIPPVPHDSPTDKIKAERELLMPRFINRHAVSETHDHISFVYFATSQNRTIDPAPGEKRDGFKWFTKEELNDRQYGVIERVRHYATEALTTINT